MIQKLYTWYGKRVVNGVAAVVVLLVIAGIAVNTLRSEPESVDADQPLSVKTAPIATLGEGSARTYVGTVSAVNEASLNSEVGGRVVSVPVSIGDRVSAGGVIAQLDNASERAQVTQAQGAYEAAQAGAQQSDSGIRDAETALVSAKNNALTTVKASYTTANSALINSVNKFYGSPQSMIPGVRVSGGNTSFLNEERVAFQTIIPAWQTEVDSAQVTSNLPQLLSDAETKTLRMLTLVDAFIEITSTAGGNEVFQGQPLSSYSAGLLNERTSLNQSVQNIRSAKSALISAEEGIVRANIGGTNADVSLANAQVKQALGSLQSAQAQLAKTIIRSPIAGTVNALQVKVGDFIGGGAPVAEVVNASAYELSIYVNEIERETIAIGDIVKINSALDGVVTNIAPALDARTQKVEVKIAIESTEILSGATAIVSLATSTTPTTNNELTVPLTAVAFSIENGAVLVVRDGLVQALPVTLGEIRGSQIAISGDVSETTEIIVDARGLVVGQKVSTEQN